MHFVQGTKRDTGKRLRWDKENNSNRVRIEKYGERVLLVEISLSVN